MVWLLGSSRALWGALSDLGDQIVALSLSSRDDFGVRASDLELSESFSPLLIERRKLWTTFGPIAIARSVKMAAHSAPLIEKSVVRYHRYTHHRNFSRLFLVA